MEKSGLTAFENFQYRMVLQKEGPSFVSKISPTDLACDTPQAFASGSEEVEGFQSREYYLENWTE
mgnify:CR=1 FL=1